MTTDHDIHSEDAEEFAPVKSSDCYVNVVGEEPTSSEDGDADIEDEVTAGDLRSTELMDDSHVVIGEFEPGRSCDCVDDGDRGSVSRVACTTDADIKLSGFEEAQGPGSLRSGFLEGVLPSSAAPDDF